jgi:hypothetical protein
LAGYTIDTHESEFSEATEEIMRALLLGFMLLAAGPALAAEKYVGSNVDMRTVLAFKVADAAVQKFLPQGWEPDVTTAGPAKDINLRVTFIDRIVNQDAEGKALDPVRIATLTIPATMKGSETRGTILFRAYVSDASVPGPYGVSVHASVNMERKVRIDAAGTATVDESWEFRSQDGDSIQLQMQYVRGASTHGKAEEKLYSAVKPEFYRIYRSEQSTDVVRGAAADRVQKVLFKASGPKLSPLFDGSEQQLIGVTSNPWIRARLSFRRRSHTDACLPRCPVHTSGEPGSGSCDPYGGASSNAGRDAILSASSPRYTSRGRGLAEIVVTIELNAAAERSSSNSLQISFGLGCVKTRRCAKSIEWIFLRIAIFRFTTVSRCRCR